VTDQGQHLTSVERRLDALSREVVRLDRARRGDRDEILKAVTRALVAVTDEVAKLRRAVTDLERERVP
jgi:hypothetical protein